MKREMTGEKAAERVRRKVRETVKRYELLKRGDHIVIGLSGGPDSVCLFFLLHELAEEYSCTLHPVHVNHQLRGEAAEADQKYAEELCRSQQLFCTVVSRNVKELAEELGVGTEEAGRQVRYQAFWETGRLVCPEGGAKVAVAQNRNDQAETVLMRMLRGTGTQGLAGMEPLSKEGIIRPLLFVDRQDIEGFCQEEGLCPRIDQTNLEPIYLRNRIRLELLPYLKEQFNRNIVGALAGLAAIAAEDRDYFQRQAEEFISLHITFQTESVQLVSAQEAGVHPADVQVAGAWPLDIQMDHAQAEIVPPLGVHPESAQVQVNELLGLHPALRKRVMIALFSRLGLKQDITAVHLSQAERLLEEKRTSSQAYFPENYRMKIEYEKVVFFQENLPKIHRQEEKNPSSGDDSLLRVFGSDPTGEKILKIRCQNVLTHRFSGKMMEKEAFHSDGWEKASGNGSNPLVGLFDAEELMKLENQGLWIRTRRPGDRIRLSGMEGSKKLQDFFVDKKVPKEVRDQMPLFCFGQNVLWIPGIRAGRDFAINGGTQMILLLEYYK